MVLHGRFGEGRLDGLGRVPSLAGRLGAHPAIQHCLGVFGTGHPQLCNVALGLDSQLEVEERAAPALEGDECGQLPQHVIALAEAELDGSLTRAFSSNEVAEQTGPKLSTPLLPGVVTQASGVSRQIALLAHAEKLAHSST